MLIISNSAPSYTLIYRAESRTSCIIFLISSESADVYEIYTEPDDFGTVMEALEGKGYEFVSADVSMIPSTYTKIEDEEAAEKMQKLLDNLEDNDDVQNVWHNWEIEE